MLRIGEQAPHIKGLNQEGSLVDTNTYIGSKNLIIYFYPKDETKGCTAQACSFRDAYEDFKDLNCEVIGISGDNEASHKNFAEHHRLPFILLSDKNKEIRKAFQVPKDFLGLIPGRYTFVINKEGVIIDIFHDAINMQKHVQTALEKIKSLG
jgi:thioredoxin-dependent peroxiredoxin